MITDLPPLFVDALAWFPDSPAIRRRAKHLSRFGEELNLLVEKDGLVGLPREECYPAQTLDEDHRSFGSKTTFLVRSPPRNREQERVIEESYRLLKEEKNHIFRATTGFGKTYCALAIAARLGTTVLVVVTKEDLMEQWQKAILKHTTLTEDDIGFVQQDRCDYRDKAIVIGMVQSIAKDKYGDDYKSYFGLVIFDEVHRMGADTFSLSCQFFSAVYRLGLSATPYRIDGKDMVFTSHIGPVRVQTALVAVPPKVYMIETGWRPRGYIYYTPGKMMGLIKALAEDRARNDRIVKHIYRAWEGKRVTIVFSDLKITHLRVLHDLAVEAGIPATEMAYYVGGLTEAQRELAKTKRIILATYAMVGEATDIPWLDVAILATPRANVQQAVGRVLREVEGKPVPIIVDFMDTAIPELKQYAHKRLRTYASLSAVVETRGL
jgi:superfamily II DNA or RNA helicase